MDSTTNSKNRKGNKYVLNSDVHTQKLRETDSAKIIYGGIDEKFFLETQYGNYEWSSPKYIDGNNTIYPFNGSYKEWCKYVGVENGTIVGEHIIMDFCKDVSILSQKEQKQETNSNPSKSSGVILESKKSKYQKLDESKNSPTIERIPLPDNKKSNNSENSEKSKVIKKSSKVGDTSYSKILGTKEIVPVAKNNLREKIFDKLKKLVDEDKTTYKNTNIVFSQTPKLKKSADIHETKSKTVNGRDAQDKLHKTKKSQPETSVKTGKKVPEFGRISKNNLQTKSMFISKITKYKNKYKNDDISVYKNKVWNYLIKILDNDEMDNKLRSYIIDRF